MRQIGVVAIVLAGLYAIIEGLVVLAQTTWVLPYADKGQDVLIILCTTLPFALIGVALIRARRSLSERWFDESDVPAGQDGPTLLRVGLILIGLVLIIVSISQLVGTAVNFWASFIAQSDTYSTSLYGSPQVWLVLSDAIIGLVELALGAWLLTRPGRLIDRLWRAEPQGVVSEQLVD